MTGFEGISWTDLAPFIVVGFAAQLVDSALGMTFGLVGNALLLLLGLPPASASAAVQTAKSFTGGVSGISHAIQRNVDWRLFRRLVVPGVIGGLLGVWILTGIANGFVRPLILVYLGAVGLYLMWRGARRPQTYRNIKLVEALGLVGGVVDGAGGGGWGPLVCANLLVQGAEPRVVIGTANASKFFVGVTISAAFIGSIGFASFSAAAAGLVLGGVVAAPIGARLTRRTPARALIVAVGAVLISASLYGVLALMFEPVPVFPGF